MSPASLLPELPPVDDRIDEHFGQVPRLYRREGLIFVKRMRWTEPGKALVVTNMAAGDGNSASIAVEFTAAEMRELAAVLNKAADAVEAGHHFYRPSTY